MNEKSKRFGPNFLRYIWKNLTPSCHKTHSGKNNLSFKHSRHGSYNDLNVFESLVSFTFCLGRIKTIAEGFVFFSTKIE